MHILIIAKPSYNRSRIAETIHASPAKPDGIIHVMSTDFIQEILALKQYVGGIPYLNHVDNVLISADKYKSGQIMAKYGVPIPETYLSNNDAELKEYAQICGYPVVLKQPDGATRYRDKLVSWA